MSGKGYNNGYLQGKAPAAADRMRFTRDFGLYLDTLKELKKEYLIIFCLKNTSGQSFPEAVVEKIHKLGFVNYTAEPGKKYAGISYNGQIVYDGATPVGLPPLTVDVNVQKTNFCVSFEGEEAEIRIDGVDQSLRDKGLNIAVYDCRSSELADVSVCNAPEEDPEFQLRSPEFYHRNFFYTDEYIDSHVYMPERYKRLNSLPLRRSYFSDRRLNVREVERGLFLPQKKEGGQVLGGVCDENFNFVAGHQLHSVRKASNPNDQRHIWGSYEVPPEELTYIDEAVLYGGTLIEHPGHLIVECFGDRMWWAAQNSDSDIKIAVEIIWSNTRLTASSKGNSFVMEILDAFGISEDRLIIIKKPTRFKKIIVPDQASVPLYYCFPYEFTSGYIKPFEHIKKQLSPGKYKKIYLTKKYTDQSNIIGEDYFIDFFKNKGFEIIHPEDYTMKEKAEIMYGADEVVTVDGTGSLFTVFCKPTVKLTVLTRRLDFWDTPQQLVTEALGIKEFFMVNVTGSFLNNFSDDPFINYCIGMTFLCVTEDFAKYVKYVYNEELDITSEESVKNGLYDYLRTFAEFYSDSEHFCVLKDIKMLDVLRSMSEFFLKKELNTDGLDAHTADEKRFIKLRERFQEETERNSEKIKSLSEKAKEFIEENASLKQTIAGLEAEVRQLRNEKAELTAYMAEINSLLNALEAQGGMPSGE